MHDDGVALGILGIAANGHDGPIRAGRFADFQRLAGELEMARPGTYLAGHTACHALMNGIDRVAFAGVNDLEQLEDGDALTKAFGRLVSSGPIDMLVAPGVIAAAPSLVDAFVEWEEAERRAGRIRRGQVSLWLDAPDRADTETVLELQRSLSDDPERVRVVSPWVPTTSPGRRRAERLPASCVAAPLYLGTTKHLLGVHELGRTDPVAAKRLEEAGCALLEEIRGRRRVVTLAFPRPRPPKILRSPGPITLEARIEAALEAALLELFQGSPVGPRLYKQVERNARSVLQRFVATGEITSFKLRCDEESSMHLHGGVGVDVWVKVPRRVESVLINVSVGM